MRWWETGTEKRKEKPTGGEVRPADSRWSSWRACPLSKWPPLVSILLYWCGLETVCICTQTLVFAMDLCILRWIHSIWGTLCVMWQRWGLIDSNPAEHLSQPAPSFLPDPVSGTFMLLISVCLCEPSILMSKVLNGVLIPDTVSTLTLPSILKKKKKCYIAGLLLYIL